MGTDIAVIDTLNDLQRAWVEALVSSGDGDPVEAARVAGYGKNSETREQKEGAYRAAAFANQRNPKIQQAIREEAGSRLYTGAMIGVNVVMQIATDPGHKDRLKAAKMLMEHNGFQIISQQEINVVHNTGDNKVQIEKIVEIAGRLGLNPRDLLGTYGVVLDAEFKLVEDKRPVGGASGLEDLL